MYEKTQKASLFLSLCLNSNWNLFLRAAPAAQLHLSGGFFLHPFGANKEIVTIPWWLLKICWGRGNSASIKLAQCMRAKLKLSATYYSNSYEIMRFFQQIHFGVNLNLIFDTNGRTDRSSTSLLLAESRTVHSVSQTEHWTFPLDLHGSVKWNKQIRIF